MSDAEFSFEHSFELDEGLYVELHGMSRRNRPARLAAIAAAGVALLFWPYTLILGLVVLGIVAFAIFVPRKVPGMSARVFREYSPHLHSPITYGVSESELWTEGKDFSQRCSWGNLAVWEIKGEWLRLEPRGSVALYFPIAALEEAGILEPVKQLAMRHGTEFDKPKGRAS